MYSTESYLFSFLELIRSHFPNVLDYLLGFWAFAFTVLCLEYSSHTLISFPGLFSHFLPDLTPAYPSEAFLDRSLSPQCLQIPTGFDSGLQGTTLMIITHSLFCFLQQTMRFLSHGLYVICAGVYMDQEHFT